MCGVKHEKLYQDEEILATFRLFVTSARESVAEQVERLRVNIAVAGEQLTRFFD